jgi:hypothetical protein
MPTAFSRRKTLTALGLLALAPGAVRASSAARASPAPGAPLSPRGRSSDAQLLRDFMRMRGSAAPGEPVRWVYSGVLVVKPEGELARPVARIEGLSRTRATERADGSWDWQLDEAGYYCDLESGHVLERLRNPFTGEEVRPVHYRSPQKLRFAGSAVLPLDALPPGIDFRGEVTQLASVGDVLALTEDLYVRLPAAPATADRPARPQRISSSLATFTSSARALARGGKEWVDCQFAYTTLNSFVGWLGMDGQPGVQNMRLIGVKCRLEDRESIPDALHERLAADHPDLLA